MRVILKSIRIKHIDFNDLCYVGTYPLKPPAQLVNSIKTVGLINPPILEQVNPGRDKRFRIICGWRRVAACKKLRYPELDAYVLQPVATEKEPVKEHLLLAFYDNLSHRSFNPVEKAHWLKKLVDVFGAEQTRKQYMPLLGVSKSYELLRRYLVLATASEPVKKLAVSESISLKEVLVLSKMTRAEQRAFVKLSERLQLGVNLRREFLHLLYEISRRDDIKITELLNRQEIAQILNSSQRLPKQVEDVRRVLRSWRYPELSGVEEKFHSLMRALKLPTGIRFQPSEFFEDGTYSLSLSIQTAEQLRSLLGELNKREARLSTLITTVNDLILSKKEK
ncbi:ParB/RepB/Spo0J family partition protein [Candidatus Sumerlaeota bacterium]|nr:ParB/RepB/Spo0J family partition protein [Candidatus Sumerlaeota bacterium]